MSRLRVLVAVALLALGLVASCDEEPSGTNDVSPPGRVTNLATELAGPDSVLLTWTAPGDDGFTGDATSYDIRRSLQRIDAENFAQATVVPSVPPPLTGGTAQQFVVPGVDTTMVTHFAIRAVDEVGNISVVSNDAAWPRQLYFVADLVAHRDNTLYQDSLDVSNGQGAYLFTGRGPGSNTTAPRRRALIRFPIGTELPASAIIDSVQLTVHVSNVTNDTLRVASLHRLTANWGEGASNAGDPGDNGTTAKTNDATWKYRYYKTDTWVTPGGTFAGTASAQTSIGGIDTSPAWSSITMRNDVRAWLANPSDNFGWIVIGDESAPQTAKRFDSSENPTAANRPRLRVYYTVVQ